MWLAPQIHSTLFASLGQAEANRKDLRILRGDAMEPLLSEGDRLVIDTARTHPTTGELWELWDSSSLAVRRVEIVPRTEPAQSRLTAAHPNYAPFTCLAEDARNVGTVLWIFRRP